MLEILPKIFFSIVYFMKITFFAFVVYATLFLKNITAKFYYETAFFFILTLIVHAIGVYLYDETLDVIEETGYYDNIE